MQVYVRLIMQATNWETGDIYEVQDNNEYPNISQDQTRNSKWVIPSLQECLEILIKQYSEIDPRFFVFKLLDIDDSKIHEDQLTIIYLCNIPYDAKLLKGQFVKRGQYGQ